jgi:predicted nuclease of predicted toxin-antitoxin system
MKLWIDAQLSPALAPWISATFPEIEAFSVRFLGLREAEDREIFQAARAAEAVVMTKDSDSVQLLEQHAPPPKVLWITCGNTSNARMREILRVSLPQAVRMLGSDTLIEISDI